MHNALTGRPDTKTKEKEILTANAVLLGNSLRLEIRTLFTCKQPQLREREELNTPVPIQFDELLVKLRSNGDNAASTPQALEVADGDR